MVKITFVRHGLTDWNKEKRAQGQMHNPLNEEGKKQAAALTKSLAEKGRTWDFFFSSDLLRARQTAEIISEGIGLPITSFDERLREIDSGLRSGTTQEERIKRWGENWKSLDLKEESRDSVRQRGLEFVEDMATRYPSKTILVVSHGVLLKETFKTLVNDPAIIRSLDNTSVSVFAKTHIGWDLEQFNCTKHLQP